MVIHLLACVWVGVGFQSDKDLGGWFLQKGFCTIADPENPGELLVLKANKNCIFKECYKVYFTSFYFVATTTTTVGYGDIFGYNNVERFYIMLLEFFGISIFSIILGNISNLQTIQTNDAIVQEKKDQITYFLFQIDRLIPNKKIENFVYDNS
jgi:hypothetical protein